MTKIIGCDAQWLDESAFPPLITAAEQLAVDEAILDEAESGLLKTPVVRTWQAAAPVVVLGSSSELLREVNYDACTRLNIPVLRRPSGGATVILGPGCIMWSSVLYHGTLLDEFPLELVGQLLRHPPREPEYRHQRIHSEFLTNLSLGREQIDKAVRNAFSANGKRTTWPQRQTQQIIKSRYGKTSWTERL